jgi:hypothetical protein
VHVVDAQQSLPKQSASAWHVPSPGMMRAPSARWRAGGRADADTAGAVDADAEGDGADDAPRGGTPVSPSHATGTTSYHAIHDGDRSVRTRTNRARAGGLSVIPNTPPLNISPSKRARVSKARPSSDTSIACVTCPRDGVMFGTRMT